MIRSSALLIAAAMAVLVAGVFASSLELIYISILISILAAVVLSIGVFLRRKDIFGEAEPAPGDTRWRWAATDAAGVAAMARGHAPAGLSNGDGADLANGAGKAKPSVTGDEAGLETPQGSGEAERTGEPGGPGEPAVPGLARAGAGPARRAGEAAEPEPEQREPAEREPGGREPAEREAEQHEPADREAEQHEPAEREPEQREPAEREAAVAGATDGQLGWPPRKADRGQAASREHREPARPRADRAGTEPAGDQEHAPPVAGREREAAGQPAAASGAGDDFWDRVSDELAGSGRRGPVPRAWPATAGPRAVGGAGPASRDAPGGSRDREAEPLEPAAGAGQEEPTAPRRESTFLDRRERAREQSEKPAAAGPEPRQGLAVPRFTGGGPGAGRQERGQAGVASPPGLRATPGVGTSAAAPGNNADVESAGWSAWRAAKPQGGTVATGDAQDGPETADDGTSGDAAGAVERGAGGAGERGAGDDDVAHGAEAAEGAGGAGGRGAGDGDVAHGAEAAEGAGDSGASDVGDAGDQSPEARAGAAEDTTVTRDGSDAAAVADDARDASAPDAAAAREQSRTAAEPPVADEAAGDNAEPGKVPELARESASGEDAAAGPGEDSARDPGEDGPGEDSATGPDEDPAADLEEGPGESAGEGPGASSADRPGGAVWLDDEVTIVPGVARYHRRGCILIRFLSDGDLEIMTRRAARDGGCVPCKACQPDDPSAGD